MNRRWWYALLVLPFAGTLIPPLYNHLAPSFIGLPFFYWYQLLWVIFTSMLLGVVVIATRKKPIE